MARMTDQQRANQAAGIARAKRHDPSKYAGRKRGATKLSPERLAALVAELAKLPEPDGFGSTFLERGRIKRALAKKYGVSLSTIHRYDREGIDGDDASEENQSNKRRIEP